MDIRKTGRKLVQLAVVVVCCALPLFADSATVVSVKGKVEVSRNGAWVALAENDTVAQGEIISTGFKSEAVLKYQGSVMQMGPLTRVTLEKLAQDDKKDTVSVYLNTGAVKSTVKKTENKRVSYTVRNPVAVASVRGTDFDFSGDGRVKCSEGAVVTYPAKWSKSASSGAAPAEGESDAATAAEDIAPDSPGGAVVVLPGQSVVMSTSGFSAKPAQTAASTATAVQSAMATPVNTEGVSSSAAAAPLPPSTGAAAAPPSTGAAAAPTASATTTTVSTGTVTVTVKVVE